MKDRRQNRINRLATRVKALILENEQSSFELTVLRERHPLTWREILNQLKEDNEFKPLLGPGDES
jgi:archaellum component FlaC